MPESTYQLAGFDTTLGSCAIAWGPRGICRVHLPEESRDAVLARVQRDLPGAVPAPPPPHVAHAIAGIQALLRGEKTDLSDVALDFTGVPAFHAQVYALARSIPLGSTRTYGELATALGKPGGARAVGQALGRNPFAPVVPCHRILAAGGRMGGFSAYGGLSTKARLLMLEGAARAMCVDAWSPVRAR
jgi:methylated-DNA-[protein]-cysteine S-methyltransferase